MPAAEDEDPSRIGQGFTIPAALAVAGHAGYVLPAPGGIDSLQGAHLAAALYSPFPYQGHAPLPFIADIESQPRRRLLAQGLKDG